MKILSIDDSKAVQGFLRSCFEGKNHELDFASNGKDGIDKALAGSHDLVLLDWEMPGMTGPEVLENLKSQGYSSPIIMLTSKNDTNDIVQVIEKGASEYVMKPFTAELIFEKIEAVLGVKI